MKEMVVPVSTLPGRERLRSATTVERNWVNWDLFEFFSEMCGARALVQVPLDRWFRGASFLYETLCADVSSF